MSRYTAATLRGKPIVIDLDNLEKGFAPFFNVESAEDAAQQSDAGEYYGWMRWRQDHA